MVRMNQFLVSFLIAGLCFAFTGCPDGTPDTPPANGGRNGGETDDPTGTTDPTDQGTNGGTNPADDSAITIIQPTTDGIPGEFSFDGDTFTQDVPEVVLSETLAATCLVKVGDTFPTGILNDLAGTPINLSDLIGVENYKYTIIFFWNSSSSSSLQELEDMDQEMLIQYGPHGLMIIGINEKDSPEMAQEKLDDAGADLPILMDPDGEFFDKVATEIIARTYLLDAEGTILWFDIEYSEATRRTLRHAIESLLDLKTETVEPEDDSFDCGFNFEVRRNI